MRACRVKPFVALFSTVAAAVIGLAIYQAYASRHATTVCATSYADMHSICTGLKLYKQLTGDYPTTAQGLSALVSRPQDAPPGWRQLFTKVPLDPWGTSFIYRYPSKTHPEAFELISLGADRAESNDDIRTSQ
jgi:general secretion pathway protein G